MALPSPGAGAALGKAEGLPVAGTDSIRGGGITER
jgi:hypothetical protein